MTMTIIDGRPDILGNWELYKGGSESRNRQGNIIGNRTWSTADGRNSQHGPTDGAAHPYHH